MLFEILFAAFGIVQFSDSTSPPKLSQISFQNMLDTCTKPENSNSEECQYFISNHRWQKSDIPLVFDKVLEKASIGESPAINILEKRLLPFVEHPNFDLGLLGNKSCERAIVNNQEPFALAIWPHLENYKKEFPNHQLEVCTHCLTDVIKLKMLPMLKKMVALHPEILHQASYPLITMALRSGNGLAMIEFLSDHGVEISHNELTLAKDYGYNDIFEWAILKYRYSRYLLYNSFVRNPPLAIEIWNFVKRNQNSDMLLQLCKDTVVDVASASGYVLFKHMQREFPDCVLSKGDTLMNKAVNDDNFNLILFLLEHGVEIKPEHFQILHSRGDTITITWATLSSQLSSETLLNSDIKYDYLLQAIVEDKIEICEKIISYNIFGKAEINAILSQVRVGDRKDCYNLFRSV